MHRKPIRVWGGFAVCVAAAAGVAHSAGAPSPTASDTPAPAATRAIGPLAAGDAAGAFELEPGLAVQLVAAEPLVASPCAVAWDERGRMFVAENRGYPVGGPGGKPAGVVAQLEDTDGDGLPDRRSEFATGLAFPNGLMPWRGGVIVTDAPDVLYLKDADGDGRADGREVLLTGFATDKSTQLRANDPTLGPDGWVYLAGGLSGGRVRSPKRPDRVLDLGRSDVKFRPDTGEVEPVDGKGQFGLTFDDAGHRFVCNNRVQVQHAPLPQRYLARNPDVASPGVLNNCPDLVRNVMLGLGNDAGARIFPISANLTTADSHAGTYSAACAVHVARGDALPNEYVGRAWSCDPTGNLVRYDALEPAGASFHARRVRDEVEALRTRDDWFRPVFLADGPDGALYVCDMYRKTIEHPEYLPEEVRKRTDFESGKDLGRIWRIVRADASPAALASARAESVKLVSAPDAAGLVAALRSPNGWTRDTAARLITERGASRFVAQLEATASDAAAPASTVVCCLNLLANAGSLGDATLSVALGHGDSAVRENAARLCEGRLGASRDLADRVLTLTADPHVHVRYAAVLAVGEIGRAGAAEPERADATAATGPLIAALARIAVSPDAGDKWFRAALCTALPAPDGAWRLLAVLPAAASPATPAAVPSDARRWTDGGALNLRRDLGRLCAAGAGDGDLSNAMDRLLAAIAGHEFDARAAVLVGFVDGGGAAAEREMRRRVADAPDGDPARDATEAGRVAADPGAATGRRVTAAELLASAGRREGDAVLLSLVAPEHPVELAVAAARGLVRPSRDAAAAAAAAAGLLERKRWQRYSPAIRGTVLTLFTGRPALAAPVVDAIESGAVPVAALGEAQRAWLRQAEDPVVRARAGKLLAGGGASADRRQAFEDARAALRLTPNPAAGRGVFANLCANCHRLDREGYAVGPDLYGMRSQPKESILLHIVIPEQEVAANFAAYDCVTTDGRTLSGIMSAETPASITLRQALGIEETVPRERIKRLQASPFSLMPPGLEQAMTRQEMADLLAYLRGEK